MASIEKRLTVLEMAVTLSKAKPYLFLIADTIEQAQADWVQSNKLPFPADRPVVLFSIIKTRREDVTP